MNQSLTEKHEFLSDYEIEVFKLVNEGNNPEKIAEKLNANDMLNKNRKGELIKRNAANIRKTKVVVRNKIEKELQKIANVNRLDLDLAKIPKDTGLMIAFDWVHNTKVYLFFTIEKGIIAWWEHECSDRCHSICQETLNLIRKERNIPITPEQEKLSLLEQFRYVVNTIQVNE